MTCQQATDASGEIIAAMHDHVSRNGSADPFGARRVVNKLNQAAVDRMAAVC